MKPGDLRAWCLSEILPKGRSPFLIIDVTPEQGTELVTILDCGELHTFSHQEVEDFSIPLISREAKDEDR